MIFSQKPVSKWFIVALIECVLIFSAATWMGVQWWKTRTDSKKTMTLPTVTVEAKPVEMGNFESFINAVGVIKSHESIEVAAQEGGVVKDVRFKSGDHVKKDDVLVQMNDALLQAEKEEHQARLSQANITYDRYMKLFEKKAVPKSKKDEAFASKKIEEARLQMVEEKLERTLLRAPFDGIVGLKDISVGGMVKPGDPIVSLNNIDFMLVDFKVSEFYLDKLHVGKSLEIEVDGFPDNVYTATIESIDPVAEVKDHSIRVRAKIQNVSHELKPGLFARVKLTEDIAENTMLVPEAAIETEGNQEFVYAIIDGIAHHAPVKTGRRNGTVVEIKSGLKPGIMVVTSGQLRLGDGFPVLVVPQKAAIGYKK